MTKVRVMLKCTLGPLARRKVERDFDDEVRFHLQMETENNLRKGMTEEEARNRALAQFGRVAAVKETCRETRSLPWMEVLWQELGFGMRMLRRSPGFAALTVLCLTLGIGASTSALSWLEVICVRPVPLVSHQERLMAIIGTNRCVAARRIDRYFVAGLQGSGQELKAVRCISRPSNHWDHVEQRRAGAGRDRGHRVGN